MQPIRTVKSKGNFLLFVGLVQSRQENVSLVLKKLKGAHRRVRDTILGYTGTWMIDRNGSGGILR